MELYTNAAFICERLLAITNNHSSNSSGHHGSESQSSQEDVKLMLAESYIGLGKIYKAYDVLKSSLSH